MDGDDDPEWNLATWSVVILLIISVWLCASGGFGVVIHVVGR